MARNATVTWYVWLGGGLGTGNDSNGGGYDASIVGGTDWSQQASAQYAVTDAVTNGTTTITSAAASFGTDVVGNVLQISGGTGSVAAAFYTIVSRTNSTTIVVDSATGLTTGTGATLKVGGALLTLNKAGVASAAVAGNTINVNGSVTGATTSDGITNSGTAPLPILVRGYATTPGDGYTGRTGNIGPLITTNFASISTSNRFGCNSWTILESLSYTSGSGAPSYLGSFCITRACVWKNTNTAAGISQNGSNQLVINCDISAVNTSSGFAVDDALYSIIGCHITSTNGTGIGRAFNILDNVIYKCGQHGISYQYNGNALVIRGNTIVGCGGDGIKLATATNAYPIFIQDNMITDNTGAGINENSSTSCGLLGNNFFRNNGTDLTNLAPAFKELYTSGANSNTHATTGTTGADYNNYAGNDFTLAAGSSAIGTGIPYNTSPGCFQRASGGSSGGIQSAKRMMGGMQ
jgi:hypothetical protein